jgi:hypothetical protein
MGARRLFYASPIVPAIGLSHESFKYVGGDINTAKE